MSRCEYYEQMNNNLKELDEGVSFENVPSNRTPTKKSLEILYERTNCLIELAKSRFQKGGKE